MSLLSVRDLAVHFPVRGAAKGAEFQQITPGCRHVSLPVALY